MITYDELTSIKHCEMSVIFCIQKNKLCSIHAIPKRSHNCMYALFDSDQLLIIF